MRRKIYNYKSLHTTAETYISALIDGKVNINTVREMVGHADERTTPGNYTFDRKTDSEKAQMIENAHKKTAVPTARNVRKNSDFKCAIRGSNPGHPD